MSGASAWKERKHQAKPKDVIETVCLSFAPASSLDRHCVIGFPWSMANPGSIRGASDCTGGSDPCRDPNPALLTNPRRSDSSNRVSAKSLYHTKPCGVAKFTAFLSATYCIYDHATVGRVWPSKQRGVNCMYEKSYVPALIAQQKTVNHIYNHSSTPSLADGTGVAHVNKLRSTCRRRDIDRCLDTRDRHLQET